MKILVLIVLIAPLILAQTMYRKHVNPNDEPFLPINPIYPYAEKIAKKGSDKETASILSAELYAPRPDARDSFAASFAGNPGKHPLFSGYGGFPGAFTQTHEPQFSPYSSYYGNNLFGLYSNPFIRNPYASDLHGYFNGPEYFYPDYYNHYPFASSEFHGPRGPIRKIKPNLNADYNHIGMKTKYERPEPANPKPKGIAPELLSNDERMQKQSESGDEYIDGNNFVSKNQKEVKPNAQRSSSAYNERDKIRDYNLQISQLPLTTYKVISVGGKPVGPNYPLPDSYARVKLLEQIGTVKNLVKSSGSALPNRQIDSAQDSRTVTSSHLSHNGVASGEENSMGLSSKGKEFYPIEQSPSGNTNDERIFSEISNAPVRSTDSHVYGSDERDLPSIKSAPNNQFRSTDQAFDNRQEWGEKISAKPEDEMNEDERNVEQMFVQSPSMQAKNLGLRRYQNLPYTQKLTSTVTSDRSKSAYIPSSNIRPVTEEVSEDVPSQSQPFRNIPYKPEQNYNYQSRIQVVGNSNRNQNVDDRSNDAMPQAQAFTYRLTNSYSFPRDDHQQQQPATDLEDVNFATKQGNKE